MKTSYDAAAKRYTVTLSQSYGEASEAARETQKGPLLIPVAIGLIDGKGADLPLRLEGEKEPGGTTRVLDLTEREQSFTFVDVAEKPLPSLLRNFSAPVIVEYDYTNEQLAFLLANDSDPFNRWEAGQRLATRELLALAGRAAKGETLTLDPQVVAAFEQVLDDPALTPAFRELALMLPSESYLAEQMAVSDPAAVHAARVFMSRRLATDLRDKWLAIYEANRTPGEYRPTPEDAGKRGLKNLALAYLSQLDDPADAVRLAHAQYDSADNMTDRSAALSALLLAGAAPNGDCDGRRRRAGRFLLPLRTRSPRDRQVVRRASHAARRAESQGDRRRAQADAASGVHAEKPESRALADFQLLQRQSRAVPRRRRLRLRVLGRAGHRARRAQSAGRRTPRSRSRIVAPLYARVAREDARRAGGSGVEGEIARRAGDRRKGVGLNCAAVAFM